METLASDPDEEKWVEGLYQIFILNCQDSRWGGTLWNAWTAGLGRLPAATLAERMDNLPSWLAEQWKEARVTNGGRGSRRALAELVRLVQTRMHAEGLLPAGTPLDLPHAPDALKYLMAATALGEAATTMMKGDFSFLAGELTPNRLVEHDVIDRLWSEPDKLLHFVLHGTRYLTPGDPELRAATVRRSFFYGPEHRIETVLAAPPSAARDGLLATAASLRGVSVDEQIRLTSAITDGRFRVRIITDDGGDPAASGLEEEMEE
jgi:hypothetical protein